MEPINEMERQFHLQNGSFDYLKPNDANHSLVNLLQVSFSIIVDTFNSYPTLTITPINLYTNIRK